MKKFTLLALLALNAFTAQAAEDLSLPGAFFLAKPVGFVCEANPAAVVSAPAPLQTINLAFETFTVDSSLASGLVKATFDENGASCRYSAIIKANYVTRVFELAESRAYSADASVDCAAGKAVIDATFAANRFTYWGSPRHVTFLVDDATNGTAICGANSYGIDFVLSSTI